MEESESERIFPVEGLVLCCQRGLLLSRHPLHVGVVWVPSELSVVTCLYLDQMGSANSSSPRDMVYYYNLIRCSNPIKWPSVSFTFYTVPLYSKAIQSTFLLFTRTICRRFDCPSPQLEILSVQCPTTAANP